MCDHRFNINKTENLLGVITTTASRQQNTGPSSKAVSHNQVEDDKRPGRGRFYYNYTVVYCSRPISAGVFSTLHLQSLGSSSRQRYFDARRSHVKRERCNSYMERAALGSLHWEALAKRQQPLKSPYDDLLLWAPFYHQQQQLNERKTLRSK